MKTTLVIGCGIGGPALALALQRAGFDPHLFEAHPGGADHAGSFLNLASNGLDVLSTLGVHAPIVAEGLPTPRMVMWSYTGKRLGEVANGLTPPHGMKSITLWRGALHRVLREEVRRSGIAVHWGKRLVSAESRGSRVVARFDDGSTAEGELLLGADGIHSKTRQLIDPASPAPRYTGQLSIGGATQTGQFAPTPDAYHMVFGRRAFFGYTVSPSGEAWWFANVAAPAEDAALPREEWKRRLLTLFAEDAGPAREMIAGTSEALGVYPIHDMPKVPTWHRGAMGLIGDALHATSPSAGQGASLALEDALVLAKCLRDADAPEPAFRAFERLRRRRVERVVQASRRVGSSKVAGPVARVMRDLFMPAALKLYAGSTTHDWLYRYHVDWSQPSDSGRLREREEMAR